MLIYLGAGGHSPLGHSAICFEAETMDESNFVNDFLQLILKHNEKLEFLPCFERRTSGDIDNPKVE